MNNDNQLFVLQVLTPELVVYDGPILSVHAPGVEGDLVVMSGHEPMIVNLKPGVITICEKGQGKYIKVNLLDVAVMDVAEKSCVIIARKVDI